MLAARSETDGHGMSIAESFLPEFDRGTIMNHLIHHRAQLVVYLRLNDVPVPGLYGPSADEQAFG